MSEPFLGQIQAFSFGFAPKGWSLCNGQLLPINQNQALFALLGTTYGGNGQTTFALPNLQGSCALAAGPGYVLGQTGGEAAHTLTVSELPAHTHPVDASTANATQPSAQAGFPGHSTVAPYAAAANTVIDGGSTASGGSQPHQNMAPYLPMNFCIAVTGIFPSRN